MKIITKQSSVISLLLIILLFSNTLIKGQVTIAKDTSFHPRFYLNIGVFNPTATTTLQINGKNAGAILGLEENYGFDSHPWIVRAEAIYNFKKRSGVALSFFNVNRNHEKTIDRDIRIFDSVIHIGADLKLTFNTAVLAATYRFAIFKKPQWDAGLSLGILFMRVKLGAELTTQQSLFRAESETFPAPSPTLGLFGTAYLMKNLRGRYDLDFFSIRFQGFNANVINNRVALEYYIIKNLGLGGSMTFFAFNIDQFEITKNFDGTVKYSLYGFSLFVNARF